LETIGNVKLILITCVKNVLIMSIIGDKILVQKEGILRKTQPRYHNNPCTIVSIHTNKQSGLNAETSLKDLTYDE
jgi:hypothetical protein